MKQILHSPVLTIINAIGLLCFGLYDLYEELLDPSHVHAFIFVALLLIIGAAHHIHEGVHKLLKFSRKESVQRFLEKCEHFFTQRGIQFALSLIVLVTASYGIANDMDQIYYRSTPLGFGVVMLIIPVSGGYKSATALRSSRN